MARSTSRRAVNLPGELSSFVNRRAELATAEELLRSSRLVTLIGPGGVGKTRLALRAARQVADTCRDGVWFVDLAPLQNRALLAHTVVQALRVGEQSTRDPMDVLVGYLRAKRLLLVLDNCERVSAECAEMVSTLLRAAPKLRVLVTSREVLGVAGEQILPVGPLEAPDPEWMGSFRRSSENHAVALFAERAHAAAAGFRITPRNEATVARLCHQLDGLPLAIELAAARLRIFPLDVLASRLDDHARLLLPGFRGPTERHRSLYATLSWSFQLCEDAERRMWERMSVFSGAFDLAAAEDVCAGGDIHAEAVLDLVNGLIDKSVLLREEHGGQARYRLLDTVRQFGLERLRETGEEAELRRRHRNWYLNLARQGDAEWFGPHQVAWFTRLRRDHANLRAALSYCLSTPGEVRAGLRMAATLWFYWLACGYVAEGCYWLERGLELDTEPSGERATALWVNSFITTFQGDNPSAVRMLDEARDLARESGDESTLAYVTQIRGLAALARGDLAEAEPLLTHSLERHEALDQFGAIAATGWVMLAYAAVGQGDFDRAVSLSQRCRALSERRGDIWARSWALWALSLVEWTRGRPRQAAEYARECLRIKQIFHDVLGMAFAVDMLAWTAAAEGAGERAAVLLGGAQTTWQTMGEPQAGAPHLVESRERSEATARRSLGDRAFDQSFKRGLRFDVDEAANYALATGEPGAETASPPAP
ncbi:ATP-binding protein [Gandjariella thermophila]|uniref:ATP-binding protein n=1 Tax=Gandjariella thermophila TaxID=1931992 RepID=UPI001864F79A|nr:tetratricopeptide repeat protein [Gandjariella thermophila]